MEYSDPEKISTSASRIRVKEKDRERIADDIRKYLNKGGVVQKIPFGQSSESELLRGGLSLVPRVYKKGVDE